MEKIIFLNDVLKEMRKVKEGKALPFSIKSRTFNSRNQVGGRLIALSKATLCMHLPKKNKNKSTPKSSVRRRPDHWENRTRNIEKENGDVVKIHIDLIVEFNGKQVVF